MAERVLFVHAHPDDETITTGATIATLVEAGAEVTVLTCTRGELGDVMDPRLAAELLTPEQVAAHRETELREAVTALGVTDWRILGNPGARWADRAPRQYRDSGMRFDEHGITTLETIDPGSLVAAELSEVAADIAAVMVDVRPDVVVTYDRDGGYGHPDHLRVHQATRSAAEVIGVPLYVVAPVGPPISPVRVDAAPVLDRKRAALRAHSTQLVVEGDNFRLSTGPARPIDVPEDFGRVAPPEDSFRSQGLVSRVIAGLLAAALGTLMGGVLTVVHQETVTLAGVWLPWGILAGVGIITALLVGLRVAFATRIVAACAAAGVLGSEIFLAVQPFGGSTVVSGNVLGIIWGLAPAMVTLVVMVWPTTRPRRAA
jgi:N-acetyl-1-D-myo-inositol-2-amino-2-deoxy-alpha-D-glucopyranoside deacetylase